MINAASTLNIQSYAFSGPPHWYMTMNIILEFCMYIICHVKMPFCTVMGINAEYVDKIKK